MVTTLMFFLSVMCNYIALVSYEEKPRFPFVLYKKIGYRYAYNNIGSVIKCLIIRKVQSAIILVGNTQPEFYLLHKTGRMEKYKPGIHKTDWAVIHIDVTNISPNQITEIEQKFNIRKESANLCNEISTIRKQFMDYYPNKHVYVGRMFPIDNSDTKIFYSNEVIANNLNLMNSIYRQYVFKKMMRDITKITNNIQEKPLLLPE